MHWKEQPVANDYLYIGTIVITGFAKPMDLYYSSKFSALVGVFGPHSWHRKRWGLGHNYTPRYPRLQRYAKSFLAFWLKNCQL